MSSKAVGRRFGRGQRTGGLKRGTLAAVTSLAGLLGLGDAGARTVKIVQAQTLELRRVDGQELVIITGDAKGPVELRVDDDVVRARRVEYNRTTRTLTLVGAATYHTAKDNQDLRGENLVVDLAGEQLTGEDVLISDADIEIRGGEIERVPGQLRATNGYFTPCAKCGRNPNDYAFRAERLIVYPGDRLVAYRAQLLLADVPVLYLPVIVLPLGDPERQPRLVAGNDSVDGRTIEADLPFSIGASTLGTTLIRYYQNRSPILGLGVALRSYSPLPYVDRVNLYTLANPKPFLTGGTPQTGYDVDLDFSVRGRVPVQLAVKDLDYSLNVVRRDIGRREDDPERGVTRVDFGAKVEYSRFSAEFNYVDRYGPEPTEGLSTPLKHPEVVLDPKLYTRGNFSADFKVTAGRYTAGVNTLSRRALEQANGGANITATRLEETHTLSYSAQPWKNAAFSVRNAFTGRYYSTGARTVQLEVGTELVQRFNDANTVTVRYGYIRNEGNSPFYFDRVTKRFSAPLSLDVSTVPVKDVTFSVSASRDFFQPWNKQTATGFRLNVSRTPVNLSSALSYDFFEKELESADFSLTLGDSGARGTPLTPAPTRDGKPAAPAPFRAKWPAPNLTLTTNGSYSRTTGYGPFTVRATVTGDNRANNFSVSVTRDPNTHEFSSVSADFTGVGRQDTVLNALSFRGQETLSLPSSAGLTPPRLSGSYSVSWRGAYTLSTSHDLALAQSDTAKYSGTVSFSVGSLAGQATNWQLTYGGPYDLRRAGFTQPALTGSLNATRPGESLALSATVNTPGLDQQRTEVVRADLNANWQFGVRVALSGRASYYRQRSGTFPNDLATDTLILDPLRVGIAIGNGPRPGAYLTGSLRQTFTWKDGERVDPKPLAPVIGLTIDRCCWAAQAEIDLSLGRYRLGVSLPGSKSYPLFEYGTGGLNVPLLPDAINPGATR
ncbi:LPS-assembly protein LptD [Deinococcus hopiensis]|uniref:LPS-assembly protein LptD n=1 Tax=Deinococcus hopiensis KR-140 TaxID=695939 RepID=A0A1W1VB30_9DEIO|nr:LPS-assembly protein LptD [Deinococcus hopiensis]SMB90496.1 hypothetical protein SAMN00790413_00793 [Deinococcus hopiensis KR-140]